MKITMNLDFDISLFSKNGFRFHLKVDITTIYYTEIITLRFSLSLVLETFATH